MKSINPADGTLVQEFEDHTATDVADRVGRAHAAQPAWARTPIAERAQPLLSMADRLEQGADELAQGMRKEMGKPLHEGVAEAKKCALVCRYYAENAERFLASEEVETDAARSFVAHRPLGTILAIMPWNFPYWQVVRFAAPALMAGNACLLKHAPNVTGAALTIERMWLESGLPAGLFASLVTGVESVPNLISDPRIHGVTLTGSTRAGRAVAALAGAALKPTVLELGGSDPYVILADADIALAASACADSRLLNAGQSCIAAKRFIVVPSIRDEFLTRVSARFEAAAAQNALGPMARMDLRDALHDQVTQSVAAGAVLQMGGEPAPGPGSFYPPTILTNVAPGMPAYDEELFGPVASILDANDEADAIRIANDTSFGLGAAVFTRDTERGLRIAECELRAGACFVNDFVKSDPRLPFGGTRDSGYGRELSALGIRAWVNPKTIVSA